jgi:hypothetical protein
LNRITDMKRSCLVIGLALIATLGLSASATASLPKIGKDGVIKANKSIGGVKLDMTQTKVTKKWGKGSCTSYPAVGTTPAQDLCDWSKAIPAGTFEGEYAHVTFIGNGGGATAAIISITAQRRASDGKLLPGKLSKWKTPKGLHLGSPTAKVGKEFPAARPNTSEGVNGFELLAGAQPDVRITRFFGGFNASADRLSAISLEWDICHVTDC